MTTQFTFVANSLSGSRARRHRSRKACDLCRHRKRRCHHETTPSSTRRSASPHELVWCSNTTPLTGLNQEARISRSGLALSPGSEEAAVGAPTPDSTNQEQQQRRSQQSASHPDQQLPSTPSPGEQLQQLRPGDSIIPHHAQAGPSSPRFVGDLNPEARLLDKPTSPEDSQEMTPGEVGVWIQSQSHRDRSPARDLHAPSSMPGRPSTRAPDRILPPVSDLLCEQTIQSLSEIYFKNIHPLIPLLNEDEYWQLLAQRTVPMPLVHIVCLLAAKDDGATGHLKLLQSGNTLTAVRQFCSQLYVSISTAVAQSKMTKKTLRMRILGLLSLHHEGGDGAEEASHAIAQAMHMAQSLALHQPRPGDVDNESKRTFWCLWILDRLNAATNSRPCVMADIDIAVAEITPHESGSVAFDVLFRIARSLTSVIGLYRPGTGDLVSGLDSGFPDFEQIMDELHAWQLPSSVTATLHIFYLATAILAHRLKTITSLPAPTLSRLRQQLSAIQVIRHMRDPARLRALCPFPIVVYASSLALSVSYQQLRYSRLPSDQEDARQDFDTACDVLQTLRRTWASADAMASLAHRTSTALNQLPSLEVLRVNRSGHAEQPPPNVHARPADLPQTSELVNRPLEALSSVDATDLFAGMNDVSWMFLDAENPINFGSLPFGDL